MDQLGAATIQSATAFQAALPYVIGSLVIGVAGTAIALTVTSTIAIVAGAALVLIGTYALIGIIDLGIECSDNPGKFKGSLGKAIVKSEGAALTDMIGSVAQMFFLGSVFSFIRGIR